MLAGHVFAVLRLGGAVTDRGRRAIVGGVGLAVIDPNRLCFELWEYNAAATGFVPGATLTLKYWKEQHETCERHGAEFSLPQPNQLIVISNGVLQGDAVQGLRYPSPEHMSGWWITTDRYDGGIESLTLEHLYHLTAARPDLARNVALPFGFRFGQANGEAL